MNFPNLPSGLWCPDLETYDPTLKGNTTAALQPMAGGFVIGLGICDNDNNTYWFDWNTHGLHAWLRDQCRRSDLKMVNANPKYDLLWLLTEGIWDKTMAKKRYGDVIINGAIIRDDAPRSSLSLNGQAEVYGFESKKIDPLMEAAAQIGLKPKSYIENMHLLPRELVAEYAKHDAWLAIQIYRKQMEVIEAEKIQDALELEELLLPINVLAEAQGIKVDVDKLKTLQTEALDTLAKWQSELRQMAGQDLNLRRDGATVDFFKSRLGLPGRSIDAAVLGEYASDPLVELYLKTRKLEKKSSDYLFGMFDNFVIGDRIYPNIFQTRNKRGGAHTNRQIYAEPALTTIPTRDKEWGPKIMSLLLAEDGCSVFAGDFSQQEPRWIIDWANRFGLKGVEEVAAEFQDPTIDWHGKVANFADIPRDTGKMTFLATAYLVGMGTLREQVKSAGCYNGDGPLQRAQDMINKKMPFIKEASNRCMRFADQHGYARTVIGRKIHFDTWEPAISWDEKAQPIKNFPEELRKYATKKGKWTFFQGLKREEAEEIYFGIGGYNLKRAMTYKTFNNVIQGSAADEAKKSVVDAFHKHDIVINLLIYDCNVWTGCPDEEAAMAVVECMKNAYPKIVPNKVDYVLSPHWTKP